MVFLQEGFPPGLFWIGFAQNPFFFVMFYDFYKKAYHRGQVAKAAAEAAAVKAAEAHKLLNEESNGTKQQKQPQKETKKSN